MKPLKLLKSTFSYDSVPSEGNYSKPTRVFAVVLSFILFIAILLNFAVLQFVKGDYYRKKAFAQQNSWQPIASVRGSILDCNGVELAVSVAANIITVDPSVVKEEKKEMIADKLSEFLSIDRQEILDKLNASGRYKVIAEKIDIELGDKIKAWIKSESIRGVYVGEDSKRVYPGGSLACHVIGFTGRDDNGLVCGVELALNDLLTGTDGRTSTAVDAAGNVLPYDEITRIEPEDGLTAILTLDANIQKIAEDTLLKAVEKNGAIEGGAIIVMNAKNADLLAMASYPNFDLNEPYAMPLGLTDYEGEWNGHTEEDVNILNSTVWRNKALTDTYEPGSTFKTITAAMGVEEGLVTPDTPVNDTPYSLAGWTIHCWRSWDHGDELFRDALKNSCNPVMAKLSAKIGLGTFYKYVEAFGFKSKTGIMIAGEANSIIHQNPTEIDMAVASFGQRFQITAIQLATAYCAIANGGTLYQPRIVKSLVNSDGVVVKNYDTTEVRKVISKETSETVLEMLEAVVAEGTGSNAYVSGYRVAGKTGTSETTETETTGRYVVSFASIAPADDPEIVVLVMLDHPTIDGASGGRQAAPVAGEVIEKTLEYMEVERRYTELDKSNMMMKAYVPNIQGMTVQNAIDELTYQGLTYVLPDVGANTDLSSVRVKCQIPSGGAYITDGSSVYIYTDENSAHEKVTVPDLRGYSLGDAYELLTKRGLNMQADNIGNVIGQNIAGGTQVDKGTVIELELLSNNTESRG